jgi:hypothetical protein
VQLVLGEFQGTYGSQPSQDFIFARYNKIYWRLKMKTTLTTFAILGLLLLSGCDTFAPSPTATAAPTETPAPILATSADDIIGMWQFGSGDNAIFHQFDEDGTYRTAQRVLTNLQGSPQQLGEFTLEAGLLTLVTSDESPACAGQSGTYEVQLLEGGRISFILLEDQCTTRSGYWMGAGLESVSP